MDHVLQLILEYKYLVILPLAILEGPMVSLVVGFLVYTGFLNPFISFGMLMLGDVVPDYFYYHIGRYGNKKELHTKLKIISGSFDTMSLMWNNHGKKTMFLGKLAYGLSQFFLISAGLVKMPLKKFMTYAIVVSIIQFGILMTVGYYLGGSYKVISAHVKDAEVIIAVFAILFFTIYVLFAKYARKKILELKETEENEKNT